MSLVSKAGVLTTVLSFSLLFRGVPFLVRDQQDIKTDAHFGEICPVPGQKRSQCSAAGIQRCSNPFYIRKLLILGVLYTVRSSGLGIHPRTLRISEHLGPQNMCSRELALQTEDEIEWKLEKSLGGGVLVFILGSFLSFSGDGREKRKRGEERSVLLGTEE